MPPTAVVVDTITLPSQSSLLEEFKEKLAGAEVTTLPPDHELARWIEATAVSNPSLSQQVEKEMIQRLSCSGRSQAVRAALQEESGLEEGEEGGGNTGLETSPGHQRLLSWRVSLL